MAEQKGSFIEFMSVVSANQEYIFNTIYGPGCFCQVSVSCWKVANTPSKIRDGETNKE